MEENQAVKSTNGDSGEDFYEMIEAPKFVDFTASDHYIPDDDRYWFCSRVGCEQNHPEEMDSEVVDKNFRMRVMAARSPNVWLQRARRNLKCPLTAPPKSRVARLALISSISKRIVDAKVKSQPPIDKPSTTPNAKPKQAHVKAMTTPRNRKLNSNTNAFLSVKNPKTISAEVSKTTMVAKALVFQSPKKDMKKITSTEMKIPVKTLYAAMKKLEITGAKKNALGDGQPLPLDVSKKKFRGREVKSRVFDSLGTHNCKRPAAKSARVLKRRSKEKNLRPPLPDHVAQEICNEDASDMDIDVKSRHVSMQGCSLSSSAKCNEGNQDELSRSQDSDSMSKDSNESSISNSEERVSEKSEEEDQKYQENNFEEIAKIDALEMNISGILESDDKENVASINKENAVTCEDDIEHENESTTDENIAPNDNRGNNFYNQTERVPFGKLEKSKTTAKVKEVLKKKTLEENTTPAAVGGSHGMKSSRPKSTNPKPFRLRTDERVILREANLGKKPNFPLKDITASRRIHAEKLQSSNQIMNQKSERDNHVKEECEQRVTERKTPDDRQGGTSDSMNSKKFVALEHQKQSLCRQLGPGKERATKKADDNMKRTKLEKITQNIRNPRSRRDLSSKEEKTSLVPSRQLIARKETSLSILSHKDAKKPSDDALSRRRRPVTISKEPNLQRSHVPRKVAQENWL